MPLVHAGHIQGVRGAADFGNPVPTKIEGEWYTASCSCLKHQWQVSSLAVDVTGCFLIYPVVAKATAGSRMSYNLTGVSLKQGPKRPHKRKDPTKRYFWYSPYTGP